MRGGMPIIALAALALASCSGGLATREQIKAVGSSTVYPFTKSVAEAFHAKFPDRKAPVIESTGTGAGFKQFCAGIGSAYPDIADASRRMTRNEFATCKMNGAGDLLEIPIGIDGVVLAEANNGPKLRLGVKDIYLALAATPMGRPNTARNWHDVNPALPAIPIQVYGPPSTSGTRDALTTLFLERGCLEAYPAARALKDSGDPGFEAACHRIRDDGAYVDKGENDNIIVQSLSTNPNAIGIFGYSYLEENADRIHGVPVEGEAPAAATISDGKYPGARLLYIYVKKRHIPAVPGLADFLTLYENMWGPDGALTRHGLIAASERTRRAAAYTIDSQETLSPDKL
jgi:phosphate transport system substrate-binding protein